MDVTVMDAEEVDESTESESTTPLTVPKTARLRLVSIALLVLTIALIATGAVLWRQSDANEAEDGQRAEVVEVARVQALALTNVNRDNVDAQMETLVAHGTGDFLRQFNATAGTFKDVILKSNVDSTSTVAEAGIAEFSESDAVVLVALDSSVHNKETNRDEPRPYRMKVHLVQQDGTWLVEKMEFVP